jgi:23S rRNA (adenine2030-N6)-methyltransferase
MNYRHHYHAGNYADVMKHALLVQLVRSLQKKEKGFLYLDTHAGRGRYDLERASAGESLARKPEWPDGIGRLWSVADEAFPAGVREYVELVRDFDRSAGNLDLKPRFYPGSPLIVRRLARPVDRIALCEKHPEEFSALQTELGKRARISVSDYDGYSAIRASLPPPERRALVLIDPPFEAQDEFAQITASVAAGLQRFPGGVFAVWYPLTMRAKVDEFLRGIHDLNPPPTVAVEVTIAGEASRLKMKGCGVLVVNPPWQFEHEAAPTMTFLAEVLAQEPGGEARFEWIVRESPV